MLVWLPMPRIGRVYTSTSRGRQRNWSRGVAGAGIQEFGDGGVVVDGSCCNGQEH